MIWYQREHEIEGKTIELRGIYDPSPEANNLIEIQVLYGDDSFVLFEHNPYMMHDEDPNIDDIYRKYAHKIRKYTANLSQICKKTLGF